jgi:TrmH family RNA methyltransferase
MRTITSATNPLITLATSLHHAKYRTKHELFIAQGARTCTTLLDAGHVPHHIFIVQEQIFWAQQHNIAHDAFIVSDTVMKKISTTTTPSGIVCIFPLQKPVTPDIMVPGLVLVDIADPGNMGTLIRTAAALKAASIFVIGGTDPWSPKVVQATAGTIGLVSLQESSWHELQSHAAQKNIPLYALAVSGGKSPRAVPLSHGLLVLGSEAHGLTDEIVQSCTDTVTLPMPGGTESLNAAIAGSIALYLALEK